MLCPPILGVEAGASPTQFVDRTLGLAKAGWESPHQFLIETFEAGSSDNPDFEGLLFPLLDL